MSDSSKTAMKPDNVIYASHESGREMKWRLIVYDVEKLVAKDFKLLLVNTGNSHELVCPACVIDNETGRRTLIEADISAIREIIENCNAERWRAYLTVKTDDEYGTEKTYKLRIRTTGNHHPERKRQKKIPSNADLSLSGILLGR